MSKPYPEFIQEAWCWFGGWAYALSDADWCAEHHWRGWRRTVWLWVSLKAMDALSPFWWWVRE